MFIRRRKFNRLLYEHSILIVYAEDGSKYKFEDDFTLVDADECSYSQTDSDTACVIGISSNEFLNRSRRRGTHLKQCITLLTLSNHISIECCLIYPCI